MKLESPIGIFDSGIGGLTVARQVRELLPNEQIVYFGDTAHLPYGDKSEAAIQAYCIKIADVLLGKSCKIILIACNSASSVAYELLKEYTGSRAKVINVIDPMVSYVSKFFAGRKVGLIGTKRTILSKVYERKLIQQDNQIELKSLATPLLVPMIEEGFLNNSISSQIIKNYLNYELFNDINGVILGCTHYPLIKQNIERYFGEKVEVIDSAHCVAKELKNFLKRENLENKINRRGDEFLISDYTDSFAETAKRFFQGDISVQHYPLWE